MLTYSTFMVPNKGKSLKMCSNNTKFDTNCYYCYRTTKSHTL